MIYYYTYPPPGPVSAGACPGLKVIEDCCPQAFDHDIGKLTRRWHMENVNLSKSHILSNKVDINLNVLRALMLNEIGRHVNRIALTLSQ
jgi:hypothetical protein